MAGSWTADRFPQFEPAIRRLTEQHRELEDEPLHLAISYLPAMRDQQHIFLFEVIGSLGDGISPERDLFEVTFAATAGFPMGPNEELHLILTNPRELEIALKEGWPLATEVANAIRAGDYKVLHADKAGQRHAALDVGALAHLSQTAGRSRSRQSAEMGHGGLSPADPR
jgi:hypothetical protein